MKKLLIGLALGLIAFNAQALVIQGHLDYLYRISVGTSVRFTGEIYQYGTKPNNLREKYLVCGVAAIKNGTTSHFTVAAINFIPVEPRVYTEINGAGYQANRFTTLTKNRQQSPLGATRGVVITPVNVPGLPRSSRVVMSCIQED